MLVFSKQDTTKMTTTYTRKSEDTGASRALQRSGNPYGNGYGLEMDGNGAQFVKRLWIGLDLGKAISLKRYNRYRTFIKHDISNTEARSYPKNTAVIEKYEPNLKH